MAPAFLCQKSRLKKGSMTVSMMCDMMYVTDNGLNMRLNHAAKKMASGSASHGWPYGAFLP